MARPEIDIRDSYVIAEPSPREAFALFEGEWASAVPGHEEVTGKAGLFADGRVIWAERKLSGFQDKTILELGPLEGGHTSMLCRAGARRVLSIEANRRAFLKCLIVKNHLGLAQAEFVLGDFRRFLEATSQQFDIVFASGVLYHMEHPIALLEALSRVSPKLFLWTHYYDAAQVGAVKRVADNFVATSLVEGPCGPVRLHRRTYGPALKLAGFCGGPAPISNWLERADILSILGHLGYTSIEIGHETPGHANGPAFCIAARRD